MHPQDMRRYFFLPKFIEIFMETPCWHHGRTWSIHVQYTQTESIRLRHFTIRLDSHVTSKLDSHGVASRKSTTGMTKRQQSKRFVSIRWNRVHELISSLSNRKYQRRIDSSWVYWTTLENLNDFSTYRKRQSYILLTSPNSRR